MSIKDRKEKEMRRHQIQDAAKELFFLNENQRKEPLATRIVLSWVGHGIIVHVVKRLRLIIGWVF